MTYRTVEEHVTHYVVGEHVTRCVIGECVTCRVVGEHTPLVLFIFLHRPRALGGCHEHHSSSSLDHTSVAPRRPSAVR